MTRSKIFRCCLLGAAAVWCGLTWLTYRGRGEAPPAAVVTTAPAEKHYVTPKQLVDSGAMQEAPVRPFTALTHEGRRLNWDQLVVGRPTVLVFVKKGCPCSVEFEPFFHRLARAYAKHVRFFAVIDAGSDDARRYWADNHVPYPVLADTDLSIIARFQAQNGGYVALLRPGGTVETLWPGCSATMFAELGRKIAGVAGVPEQPLDTKDTPEVLTTGCPYRR